MYVNLRDKFKLKDITFTEHFSWLEAGENMAVLVRSARVDTIAKELYFRLNAAPPAPKIELRGDQFELPRPGDIIKIDSDLYLPEVQAFAVYGEPGVRRKTEPAEPESEYPDWDESEWSDDEATDK